MSAQSARRQCPKRLKDGDVLADQRLDRLVGGEVTGRLERR